MTDSPQAEPLGFETIDEVLTILRERGQRISTACRLVLEALFAADGPASAQFIADALTGRDSTPDPASVYRNLERLERLGVVKHVHLGHGPGLYMLVGAGGREFLACERCGRVHSLDPGELDPIRGQIRRRFGYEARFDHFPIIGLCAECAAEHTREGVSSDSEEPPQTHSHEHSHGDYVHSHPHVHAEDGGHSHRH